MSSLASRFRIPHVFIFLFYIILACSILTYIIPSGSFDRTSRTFGTIPPGPVPDRKWRVPPSPREYAAVESTLNPVLGSGAEVGLR